ncbi:helix-turn-helix transcriptional regulator [Weeksellaceae bacterium A-14]
MTLNERISKIIEYSQLSSSEFADEVEVQRSSISHITSGRNKPSLDFLIKVKEKFPEIQWDWLINGEGEMLMDHENEKVSEEKKAIPLPDLFAMIDDDNFGKTESEDRIEFQKPRDFPLPKSGTAQEVLSDSQPLETNKIMEETQHSDTQNNNIKRIVIFYENGKFESYEP